VFTGEGCADDLCSSGQPQLPEALVMLRSLPRSLQGCLMEAARLCSRNSNLAQASLLNHWRLEVNALAFCPRYPNLSPIRFRAA